jgi:sodium/bile acid cotransporter 7
MTWRMSAIILAPVVLGQALRLAAGERIRVVMPLLRHLPPLSILVFVFIGFSAAGDRLTAEPGLALRFLIVSALLHATLLAFTLGASRWLQLSPEETAAVAFCGSQKTLPNGIYLWDRFFPANPHGAVPLVQYHLLQLVLDSLIAPRFGTRRRSVRGAEVDDLASGGA